MTFFLTGGGDQEHFKKLDRRFVEELPNESVVGVLAQASDDPIEGFERVVEALEHQKISRFEMVRGTDVKVNDYDGLYIEGGNTFQLIRAVRDSNLFNFLKAFAHTGKPIYADSAGAIVLGGDVHTAFLGDDRDEDEFCLQDYRGLDLLSPWSVHAHGTADDLNHLNDLLYSTGGPIMALSEEAGVEVLAQGLQVYGDGPVWLVTFEGVEVLAPGQERPFS